MRFLPKSLRFLGIALFSALLLGGAVLGVRILTPDYSVYDRALWMKSAGLKQRRAMIPAIEARLRRGMTRQAATDLLGPPEYGGVVLFEYDLGADGGFVTPNTLSLRFDAQDRLESWRVIAPDPTMS